MRYGISEGALALLRTLGGDHSPREPVADRARAAKQPFAGLEKTFGDEFDREQYRSFWEEYERLLASQA